MDNAPKWWDTQQPRPRRRSRTLLFCLLMAAGLLGTAAIALALLQNQ